MLNLIILGNVNTVLEGRVQKNELLTVYLENIPYGLGAGVFENEKGFRVGEALVYEGQAYIYVPDTKWSSEKPLKTPFLMGISQKPKNSIQIFKDITLASLYQELLEIYPKGFVVTGTVAFSILEVAYLKEPPVFKENINAHQKKYWEHETWHKTSGSVFGVVLPYLNKQAFYQNPNDSPSQSTMLYSHTHVLIKDMARHLLTQSEISSAKLHVESIKV